ncbi:MAG: hypothetical protein HRT45_03775 [Bdellovibrionales bacterium]|nr:hypothetical protein [Bdellovibrionales bacterium]
MKEDLSSKNRIGFEEQIDQPVMGTIDDLRPIEQPVDNVLARLNGETVARLRPLARYGNSLGQILSDQEPLNTGPSVYIGFYPEGERLCLSGAGWFGIVPVFKAISAGALAWC